MLFRRVAGRRLDYPCEEGRLRGCYIPHMLSEIYLGCSLYAINAMSHINIVKVQVQDLVLIQVGFKFIGKDGLAYFPVEALFRTEYEGFYHLLSYRAPALRHPAVHDIFD